MEGFDRLSEKYGIPVIYDAAHAFGVTRPVGASVPSRPQSHSNETALGNDCGAQGTARPTIASADQTIATAGAMSMFSFHPTKLFHSCEGGCLVFNNSTSSTFLHGQTSLQEKLFQLRNFAIKSETECVDVGSNAKMNELQALMGLCCLKKMPELLAKRQAIYDAYASVFSVDAVASPRQERDQSLHSSTSTFNFNSVRLFPYSANHAYIPVLFKTTAMREKVYTELKEKCNVYSRRYFYPLLTDFAPYIYAHGTCPIAEDIASRVLTLPTYYDLALEDARDIARNVMEIVE